jgi:autotransporter-associated beta strand protein
VLSNGGSGDQVGIVPYFIGDNNVSGSGSDLVTYGNDGLRPLTSSEYATSLSADRNVKLTDTVAATDALNVRSLVLGNNSTGTQLTVNSGNTLAVTSGAILSTGSAANMISGGSITFGNNDATGYEGIVHAVSNMTIQSVIANNGAHYVGLTKGGTGVLTITADNTYLGTTNISGGTLQIGDGGTNGSIAGQTIVDNSAMVFNRLDTTTYAGSISGSGSLTKVGNNTLILAGDNTYTGQTNIQNGTLQIGSGSWTGSIVSDVVNDGELLFNRSYPMMYNGVISGDGHLTQAGTGTLALLNDNTYTGGTTIQNGTLQLGGFSPTGSIVSTGSIVGNMINNGTFTFYGGNKTFGGDISGTGNVGLTGASMSSVSLTLTGNNTYTGDTTVDFLGSLKIGNGGTSGSITSNVKLMSYQSTLIFNRSDNLTFNGNVSSGVSGYGALSKLGAGTLTLTGNLTHSGGTTISAGTLQIGDGSTSGSIAGNVTDNATLAFNRSDNITFSGAVSGTGILRKKGDGGLAFTGNNTYAGGTIIENGTLQIGNGGTSGAITGNVTDNGLLAFNHSDNISFNGIISGGGGMTKLGAGMLTLNAANTYSGNTVINGGKLKLAGSGSLKSSLIDICAGAFDVSSISGYTLSNGQTIKGAGSIIGSMTVRAC